MTNLTDLCITVAEKLGWENDRLPGGSIVVDFAGDHRSVVVTNDDPFAFIAHAKAELAKLLWVWNWDSGEFVEIGDGTRCIAFDHNPTNPLSTAEAELKLMSEALS